MAFPTITTTRDGDASAAFASACAAAGLTIAGLNPFSQLQLAVANMLASPLPSPVTVPASQVTTGTFGAGAYTFPSSVSVTTTLSAATLAGTLSTAAQPAITTVGVLASPHMTSPVVDSGGITVTTGTSAFQAVTVALTALLTGTVSVGAAQTNAKLNITYDGNALNGITFFDTDTTAVHSNTFINFERNSVAIGDIRYIGSSGKLSFNSAGSLVLGTNGTTAALTLDTTQAATFVAGVAFNGSGISARQTVTGSRGSNAALASLLTALSTIGLITDSSS